MLTLLAFPFVAIGIYYFPSDPERWLFLLPAVWLVIGIVWVEYIPVPRAVLDRSRSILLLIAIVLALGLHNSLSKLLPEALENRDLSGLEELAKVASFGDLVITPSGIRGRIYEFFLSKPLEFENLTFVSLVNAYGANRTLMQNQLSFYITSALQYGRHVYVHNTFNEGHIKGQGSPWAPFTEFDHGPETFLAVLEQFNPKTIVAPGQKHTGTYELQSRNAEPLVLQNLLGGFSSSYRITSPPTFSP
jgi:hypothetical protein